MALRWGDIEWNQAMVQIVRTAYRVSHDTQQVRELGAGSALRTIPMPEPLVPILMDWQKEQGGSHDNYICADTQHRWLHIDAPTKWFAEFISRHQLPPLNLHGLRHTAAAIMLEAGIPVNAVAAHLGHGQPSTTSNIYANMIVR